MIDPRLIDVVLPEHDGYPPELAAQDGASLCANCFGTCVSWSVR